MQNNTSMNKVYTSGRMETLCEKLAANLKGNKGSVFSKTVIITQGGGMNAWLTTTQAKTNGIFANFEFQNQDGFLGKVYELLTGQKLRSNRDAIKFGVYRLLETAEFKNEFPSVSDYYEGNDLRRIQLSEKIADLFDQYQLYRVDMIKSWEAGKTVTEKSESEEWQKWLWRELKLSSKATLRDNIYRKLESEENQRLLQKTWPEIHLFGISIYTNFHLEFYRKLGEYIPVHYYLCLPSEKTQFSHSLLESFGTKAKELLDAFSSMEKEHIDSTVESPETLLARLQDSIRNNKDLTAKEQVDSIQVGSHFTPVREVEALYNYLLDLFENDRETQSLKPRDVLVITPDINKYEPFIKAVFRNAPVRLPIQVSGAAKTTGDSITASLELLVTMGEEDLTAENVMGRLEQNRIRKAYRVEDTAYIRAVINKAGIRFGRENRLEDDTHYVSWKYGLEKIILGYAMLTNDAFDVSTKEEKENVGEVRPTNYPYRDAEASASHDLLRLKAFIDDLQSLFEEQKTPRTLDEWKLLFIEKLMGEMVWSNDFEKKDREERAEIFRALGFTERLPEYVAAEIVPWEVFVNELKKRLFTESREHALNTGAITFTSAIPARGLPYKVIAFIGLDNGVFPRQDHHLGFDLMGADYQPGDRSKKEADKSLFLDTLMSAREKLYLSYIGQSAKDNTEIPPSIVLDTLVDYLQMEKKIVIHPLHGFSNKYNDKKLFTYLYNTDPDSNLHKTKGTETTSGSEKKEAPKEEIWVNDFVKFFEAPIDWYFKKVLGIYLDGDEDDTLPETELFELNHLQKWQIKNELLKYRGDSDEELAAFIQEHIKKGELPLKNLGRAKVEDLLEEIKPLKERYLELTDGKEEKSVVIDLEVNGFRITGTIDGVFDGEYIHVSTSTSNNKEKHRVRVYLKSLLLYASGSINDAKGLLLKKNSNTGAIQLDPIDLPFISPEDARKNLEDLIEFLKRGKETPLKFSLKAAASGTKKNPISIVSVYKALYDEAYPFNEEKLHPNLYVRKLIDENYFKDLEGNYQLNDDDVKEISSLAALLNLKE